MVSGGNGNAGSKDKKKWAESKVYTRKSFKGLKNDKIINNLLHHQQNQSMGTAGVDQGQMQLNSWFDAAPEDTSSRICAQVLPGGNSDVLGGSGTRKTGSSRLENRVLINLSFKSKREMRDLRRKLEIELDLVRSYVKKIEANELRKNAAGDNGGLKRVHSEVGSVGLPHKSRPLHQLSVSVVENSQGASDSTEKEKRTPKANKLYRNSEFLLAKDKMPPGDTSKKSKSSVKKGGGNESSHGLGLGKFSDKALKNCKGLLERLMKHKHGWVFNKPVDPDALGLHDYFDIIKHPMDLGTVKTRLDNNMYKSPRDFGQDVRLTFRNAMTYNPSGQDVYVMAEQLAKIFEDKWPVIEAEYIQELRLASDKDVVSPTPSRKAPMPLLAPPEIRAALDRSESKTQLANSKPKATAVAYSGRTPAPKKPKAKDPNKREMTYDEKQKLSISLQNLPSEKLEQVVQIIKKRNSSLCHQDDEIEVDIDNVDTETLWELDRFVTNYKKSLSKNKRKAELANEARAEVPQMTQEIEKNPAPPTVDTPKETKPEEKQPSPPHQLDKQQNSPSKSSSSGSSGSDSGSSSSDSDSESSST